MGTGGHTPGPQETTPTPANKDGEFLPVTEFDTGFGSKGPTSAREFGKLASSVKLREGEQQQTLRNNFMETQRVMTTGANMIDNDDVPLRSKKHTSPTDQDACQSPDSRSAKVGSSSANGKLRRQNSVGVIGTKGKSAVKPSIGGYLYQNQRD